jgi:hypothetical protein
MSGFGDWEHSEYQALMTRGRDAERAALICWTAAGLVAAVLLSWGIGAKNSSLMLPVIFAAAFGYYATIHSRNQVRLIAGYVKEFVETQPGGPQWFTRLGHLEVVPGFNPSSDWVATILVNTIVIASVVFAWLYASASVRGDLMAGIATGCGVGFALHSIAETARLRSANPAAFWHQVRQGPAVERGPERLAMTR